MFSVNSARSKVRGNLEIYHAYIRDLDSNGTNAADPDWEIVDNESTTSVSVSNNLNCLPDTSFMISLVYSYLT